MKQISNKTILLLLAVMAIGMFALPSTLALYSGQHDFIGAEEVKCERCHGSADSIYEQLSNGSAHETFSCRNCHGFANTTINGTPNTDDGSLGHAATVGVSCMDCHSEYVIGPMDMEGLDPDNVTVVDEITKPNAAHKNVYSQFADPDDACIFCHTKATMNATIGYNANETRPDLNTWTYGNGAI